MRRLFVLTRDILLSIGEATGWTYKEVNVIVWYFVIPATWAVLLDQIFGTHRFKIAFTASAVAVLSSVDFHSFSNWLFDRSADFLNSLNALGSNYVNSSVIVCLLIPIVVYAVLLWFAFFRSLFAFVSHNLPIQEQEPDLH